MCAALGIPIKWAHSGEYGMYLLVGQTEIYPYWGIMNGPLTLTLVEGILVIVDNDRVVQHLYPLLLIRVDVLSRGRTETWNFGGIIIHIVEAGKCNSAMRF